MESAGYRDRTWTVDADPAAPASASRRAVALSAAAVTASRGGEALGSCSFRGSPSEASAEAPSRFTFGGMPRTAEGSKLRAPSADLNRATPVPPAGWAAELTSGPPESLRPPSSPPSPPSPPSPSLQSPSPFVRSAVQLQRERSPAPHPTPATAAPVPPSSPSLSLLLPKSPPRLAQVAAATEAFGGAAPQLPRSPKTRCALAPAPANAPLPVPSPAPSPVPALPALVPARASVRLRGPRASKEGAPEITSVSLEET
eukprot:596370-Pleurochrysis_carterae.AAC.2